MSAKGEVLAKTKIYPNPIMSKPQGFRPTKYSDAPDRWSFLKLLIRFLYPPEAEGIRFYLYF
jgi:hypothetical protein